MDIAAVEKAGKLVADCADMISKIKEERSAILLRQEQSKAKLFDLQDKLGRGLVKIIFDPDLSAQTKISAIRAEIRETSEFLSDIPLTLKGLDLIEAEQKEKRIRPQAELRADSERKRQIQLNLSLQKQMLSMSADSERFMDSDKFQKVVESFRRNALSLDQEAAADEFLRTLKR